MALEGYSVLGFRVNDKQPLKGWKQNVKRRVEGEKYWTTITKDMEGCVGTIPSMMSASVKKLVQGCNNIYKLCHTQTHTHMHT